MSTVEILPVPFFSDLANLAMGLRREVFVLEQGVPEDGEYDELDPKAQHFVAIKQGNVVATGRVIYGEEVARISRFAVRKSERGTGVGAQLMAFIMQHLSQQGHDKVFLNSQQDKIGFYAKHGFAAYGEVFYECDIPHRRMTNWGTA
ncbi:GNAT family N-acetyltransferase [Bremerella cremea]|uniref:GNAT family N-acetyltransferase n=1 Tax=Bremerella cremea TaxID=1031537 RepID=A0A368KR85_9BACT|nr:GNAT family N-acetyltransferase [Bremerella cremea]RCS49363.1 GNAT family N-acetyltransferase [Bremerella cremea]